MTKEQLETIVGLIAGAEFAMIAIIGALKEAGVVTSVGAIATHIERSAASVPAEVRNRELIQVVLRHVSIGLRHSNLIESSDEIGRLLH